VRAAKTGYRWHLRRLMAERDMYATTDLRPLLAERGVVLSREQVYRLVTRTPERLSLATLAALCDILGCVPGDIVEPVAAVRGRTGAGGTGRAAAPPGTRPGGRAAPVAPWRGARPGMSLPGPVSNGRARVAAGNWPWTWRQRQKAPCRGR
jgi:DNA-binding Xre family transcriptional regulator